MLNTLKTKTQPRTLNLVTTPLSAGGAISLKPYNIDFDDDLFSIPPTKFSEKLAKTSIVLASSAYEYDKAINNLESLGFAHNAKFNYSKDYDQTAVGMIISSQEMEDTTLVAVVLRGTFAKEWYSNFEIGRNVNQTKTHEGYKTATEFALDKLDMYMVNYGIDRDHCKFLITGHSRGGAVANLMAKSLVDMYGTDNVYAYTFASPNTTTSSEAKDPHYSNIYNFVNPEDFITQVPLKSWGFTKYGRTIVFPDADTSVNYDKFISIVKEKYQQYSGRELKTYSGTTKLNEFLESANSLAPTIKDYYDTNYEVMGIQLSVYDYLNMFAQILNEENMLSNGLILLGSDNTAFSKIKNYLLSGADTVSYSSSPDYSDSLISYAHTAETYLSMLEVYIDIL